MPKARKEKHELIQQEPDRLDMMVRNICLGMDVKNAALDAGYSPATANSSIYTIIKGPRFQEKMIKYVKANNLMSLPKIMQIEQTIIDKIAKNLESSDSSVIDKAIGQAARMQPMIKRKLQDAGVSQSDEAQGSQTVVIKDVQNLMLQLHQKERGDNGTKN